MQTSANFSSYMKYFTEFDIEIYSFFLIDGCFKLKDKPRKYIVTTVVVA